MAHDLDEEAIEAVINNLIAQLEFITSLLNPEAYASEDEGVDFF